MTSPDLLDQIPASELRLVAADLRTRALAAERDGDHGHAAYLRQRAAYVGWRAEQREASS